MNNVTGKNIMLYWINPNGVYFLNGSISEGTILTKPYYQFSSTQNVANSANFSLHDDGTIARFITDAGKPGVTSIVGGTWSIQYYASLTTNIDGTPSIYFKISKYDGTNITTLATSSNIQFTDTIKTLYAANITFPTTTLASNERLIVEVITVNIGARDVTFYTQGSNVAQLTTTLPVDIPFACSTNCTFNVQSGQKEVTSQTSAWYKEYKLDVALWTISCDGLVGINGFNYTNMLSLQQSRTPINVDFAIDNGSNGFTVISGKCNISNLQINAPFKDIATYSVSLQGTGAYVLSGTQPSTGAIIVRGGTVYNQEYVAAGAETTVYFPAVIGRSCVYVSRGGIDVRQIITAGSPSSEQVLWNAGTGVLTFGRALESDEFIRGLFN